MSNSQGFPYNLPIWRNKHDAKSPNGQHHAIMKLACEVSMGNPTSGALEIDGKISFKICSPAFIWSEDSKYLIFPQFFFKWGMFRRQRLLVLDIDNKILYRSKDTAYYFMPLEANCQRLLIVKEPFHTKEEIVWFLPNDLDSCFIKEMI